MLTARAKAKARAKRASQVRQSNTRRDARFTAVRMLNTLAEEIGLPGQRAPAPTARDEDVERLVRLLEVRLATAPALESLRTAARMWTETGGPGREKKFAGLGKVPARDSSNRPSAEQHRHTVLQKG